MTGAAEARLLPDGRRLHLHHGPIDLVIGAAGADAEIATAYDQAAARFRDLLGGLAAELPRLHAPVAAPRWRPADPVARRMVDACWAHRGVFVTPMAAVAGAVADEVLAALVTGRALRTAYVNNRGDIAVHMAPGESLRLGLVADLDRPGLNAIGVLRHAMAVRGIATSGWKGRSHSLGIADSVTVLAATAAAADVAATLIANEVVADHPAIDRRPARELAPDSDLGDLPVTVDVGDLDPATVAAALDRGAAAAGAMVEAGHIVAALLVLKDRTQAVGALPPAIAA